MPCSLALFDTVKDGLILSIVISVFLVDKCKFCICEFWFALLTFSQVLGWERTDETTLLVEKLAKSIYFEANIHFYTLGADSNARRFLLRHDPWPCWELSISDMVTIKAFTFKTGFHWY